MACQRYVCGQACNQLTRLPKAAALDAAWPYVQLLDQPGINILLYRTQGPRPSQSRSIDSSSRSAVARMDRLQPLALPPTQLHDFILQALFALVAGALGGPAGGLVAAGDPAGDTGVGGVAPDVGIDCGEERIMGALEGGGGQDAGELERQLFLVQVAE